MTYKANVSFAGEIVMKKDEVRELPESGTVSALVRCGYLTRLETETEVKPDETERNPPRKRKAEPAD